LDLNSVHAILGIVKEYWFLIVFLTSVFAAIAYMIIFRVNPWDAQRSAMLRRQSVKFHNSVGHELLERGRFSAAKSEYEEALKLAAVDQTALNGLYLSDLFLGLDLPDWDPASGLAIQRNLEKMRSIEQGNLAHVMQKYLGDLNYMISNVEVALRYYEKALARKPDYPDALYKIGWFYYSEKSDADGMENAFRRMAKIDLYDYRGLHGLGYALYMKAIREKDETNRAALIADAALQSGLALSLHINQLNIVMDFGEVARSGNPASSLQFHEIGRRIIEDPVRSEIGENRFTLEANLVVREGKVYLETRKQKLAWSEYQLALDYLALQRKNLQSDGKQQHDLHLTQAKTLDPDQEIYPIYLDQLEILDRLLPAI
jgi:tetratricopeptide (TPR) repeat protein